MSRSPAHDPNRRVHHHRPGAAARPRALRTARRTLPGWVRIGDLERLHEIERLRPRRDRGVLVRLHGARLDAQRDLMNAAGR